MSRSTLPAILVAVLLLSPAHAQEKVCKTPEEAVQALAAAARKVDVKAFTAVLTQPMQKMFALMDEEVKLQRMFNAALEEKFGKDPEDFPIRTFEDALKSTTKIELAEKKEAGKNFLLKLKITYNREGKEATQEERLIAVKEGEGFKLSFVPPSFKEGDDVDAVLKKELDREAQDHAKHKQVVEATVKEIKEGKYKSRQEARKAFFDKLSPPKVTPTAPRPTR